ncbi:hypothetical protein [Ponticaulis profundi]|uniref:Tektin n=1 Tax=Ponticaulis profundi TaxID=2665222 RepID=A0ABW1SBK2_9PROT
MNKLKHTDTIEKTDWVSRQRYERERQARMDVEAVLQRRSRELHEAREALRKSLHRERKIARLQSQFIRMAGRELDTLMLSIDATSARIARNTQSQNAGWIRNKCMSIQTTVTRVRVIIERTLHMADEQQLNRD